MAYDYVIAFFKRGDQLSRSGLKDGMLADVIDLNDGEVDISAQTKTAYCLVKYPIAEKARLLEGLSNNLEVETKGRDYTADYRSRKLLIDFNDLQTECKDNTLVDKVRSKDEIDIIDGMLFKDILKSSETLNDPVIDVGAVSSGSYTVGSGGDYTTWALAFADIANLTGDLTFTQISNTTESATSTITENLSTYTFTCTNQAPHYGNPVCGYDINWNFDGHLFVNQAGNGGGTIEMKNLMIDSLTGQTGGNAAIWLDAWNDHTCIVHDIIIKCNRDTANRGIYIDENTVAYECYNITIDGATWMGLYTDDCNSACKFENITCVDCDINFDVNNEVATFTNCVSINDQGNAFLDIGNATGNNNASDDASCADGNWSSGSNNQTSITVANEFISTDETNKDFMRLKSDGVCDTGGTSGTITGNTDGIRVYGASVRASIGSDEYKAKAVTGNFNVGALGDYFNWIHAAADLGATMTGNIIYTQISDTIEQGQPFFTTNTNGNDLTTTSDSPPNGDPTAGWESVFHYPGTQFAFDTLTGSGDVTSQYHRFRSTVSAGTSALWYIINAQSGHTFYVHDNMFKGNGYLSAMKLFTSSPKIRMWNNIGWGAGNGSGLEGRTVPSDTIIENCIFYNNADGIDGSDTAGMTIRNTLCLGNTVDFLDIGGGVNGYNNSSEDNTAANGNWGGTGSGNNTSITPANEIISLSDTSSDFMKIKEGGTNQDGGTTVSIVGNTVGNRGNPRPHGSDYSIGASEWLLANKKNVLNGIIQNCVDDGVLQVLNI